MKSILIIYILYLKIALSEDKEEQIKCKDQMIEPWLESFHYDCSLKTTYITGLDRVHINITSVNTEIQQVIKISEINELIIDELQLVDCTYAHYNNYFLTISNVTNLTIKRVVVDTVIGEYERIVSIFNVTNIDIIEVKNRDTLMNVHPITPITNKNYRNIAYIQSSNVTNLFIIDRADNCTIQSLFFDSTLIKSNLLEVHNILKKITFMNLTVINSNLKRSFFYGEKINNLTISSAQIKNNILEQQFLDIYSTLFIELNHFVLDNFNSFKGQYKQLKARPYHTMPSNNQYDEGVKYFMQIRDISELFLYNVSANFNLGSYGFLASSNLQSAKIRSSNFKNGNSYKSGGCFKLDSSENLNETQLYFSDTSFSHFTSLYFGGAIFGGIISEAENLKIENCQSGIGGGIYLSQKTDQKIISEIKFKNNQATIGLQNYCLGIQQVQVFSYMEINMNMDDTLYFMRDMPGELMFERGLIYVLKLKFRIQGNWYPQYNSSRFDKMNMFDYLSETNFYHPNNPSHLGSPYIIVYVNTFEDIQYFELSNFKILNQDIDISPRFVNMSSGCKQGMQKVMINYQNNQFLCKYCFNNFVSYAENEIDDPDQPISSLRQTESKQFGCQHCSSLYFDVCYGNYSVLKQGFYRSIYSAEDMDIDMCLNKVSCVNSSSILNGVCAEGHIGPLCGSCDISKSYWNNSYTQYGQFQQCFKCNEVEVNIIEIIFLLFGLLVSVGIILQANYNNLEKQIQNHYLAAMNMHYFGSSLQHQNLSSVYIKTLLFYMSIYSISNGYTQVDEINSIRHLSIQINRPLTSSILSVDCLIYQLFNANSIGFANLIVSATAPFSIFVIIAGISLVLYQYEDKNDNDYLNNKLEIKTCGVKKYYFINRKYMYTILLSFQYLFLTIFYQPILRYTLQSFLCLTLKRGQSYSILDLNINCNDADSLKDIQNFSFLLLVFIIVSLPSFILFQLFKHRNRLNKVKVQFFYGFFFKEYKQQFFYWEFIRLFLKILFVTFNTVFFQDIQIAGIMISISLVSYVILILLCKPFKLNVQNKLEAKATILSFFVLQASIMFENMDEYHSPKFVETFYFISQILSIFFIVSLTLVIIWDYLDNHIFKFFISTYSRRAVRMTLFYKWRRFIFNRFKNRSIVPKKYNKGIKRQNQNQILSIDDKL